MTTPSALRCKSDFPCSYSAELARCRIGLTFRSMSRTMRH